MPRTGTFVLAAVLIGLFIVAQWLTGSATDTTRLDILTHLYAPPPAELCKPVQDMFCKADYMCGMGYVCNLTQLQCVGLPGTYCQLPMNCFQSAPCVQCQCFGGGPIPPPGPPIAPPIIAPVTPPIVAPVQPPVVPPVEPPTSSAPSITCTEGGDLPAVAALVQCQIECGDACTYCGQVYSYCIQQQQLIANYTVDTCMIITLDYIPTVDGLCPFSSTIEGCCNGPTPIAPPVPIVPTLSCNASTNNPAIEILRDCQVDCGGACGYCGQVYSYCIENGRLLANYTLDTCMIITLDYIPTNLGFCPFNESANLCCNPPIPPSVPPVEPPVVPPIAPPVVPPIAPPVEPPVTPPVEPPVTPPIEPPVEPPVTPPVSPPVTPAVPYDCVDLTETVAVLEQCQLDCAENCSYCGQVFSFCIQESRLTTNYTLEACAIIVLDYTQTAPGFCPFLTSLDQCCDSPVPPIAPPTVAPVEPPIEPPVEPPIEPPVEPPIVPPIAPPIEPPVIPPVTPPVEPPVEPPVTPEIAVYNCTDNALIVDILEECQLACGPACEFCSEVYTFCTDALAFESNFTLSTCAIVELGFIPTDNGTCPFISTLDSCCESVVPPVAPPVVIAPSADCSNNFEIEGILGICQTLCGTGCTICAEVYTYCEQVELISAANFTLESCLILSLDSIPTSAGLCPFNTTLDSCCDITPVPPVAPPVEPPVTVVPVFDCLDNTPIVASLELCLTGCTNCTTCADVYQLCLGLGEFTSNETLDACMIVELQGFTPTFCPFASTVIECCETPPPPFAPTAYCPLTETNYALASICMGNTVAGTCADRTEQEICDDIIVALANSTSVRDCLLVGFNSSTDSVTCDFAEVVQSCCSPAEDQLCPVDLGAAERYATYVFNQLQKGTGALFITTDAGYFGSVNELGTIVTAGVDVPNDVTARTDIIAASNAMSALTPSTPWTDVISPITYTPGVYQAITSISVSDGVTITLDAQSNPYAVFVFYTDQSLTIGNSVVIQLINGAHSSNIFFGAAQNINVGAGVDLSGTFIKESPVTSVWGAVNTVEGRVLASDSSITFDVGVSSVATLPAVQNPTCA